MSKPSRDEVLKAIRESGWTGIYTHMTSATERESLTVPVEWEQIERFAAAMYAAGEEGMRERAAKVCETPWNGDSDTYIEAEVSNECAAAIRAIPITTSTEGEQ